MDLKLSLTKTHGTRDNIEEEGAVKSKVIELLSHVEVKQILFSD